MLGDGYRRDTHNLHIVHLSFQIHRLGSRPSPLIYHFIACVNCAPTPSHLHTISTWATGKACNRGYLHIHLYVCTCTCTCICNVYTLYNVLYIHIVPLIRCLVKAAHTMYNQCTCTLHACTNNGGVVVTG